MKIPGPALCAAALLASAACWPARAAPTQAADAPATTLRTEDLRVVSVGYRIAERARALCADAYPVTGLLLHHLPEYDEAGRALEIERHALDRGPGVLATVEGSPAARAGLRAGDVLLSVNGVPFPDPRAMAAERDRRTWRRQVEATEDMIEAALRAGPARFQILREGREFPLVLRAGRGCPLRIRLARSRQLNAFSDGRRVVITSRLLDFVASDDELATVIGHELAHVLLDHKKRLEAEDVPEGLLRSVGRNASRVRTTEEEADRLGLKLAWAAHYDMRAALSFWERLHRRVGPSLPFFRTHPSLGARRRLLEEVAAELRGDGEG